MTDNKNILLAVLISIAILVGSQMYFEWKYGTKNDQSLQQPTDLAESNRGIPEVPEFQSEEEIPVAPRGEMVPPASQETSRDKENILKSTPRIPIQSPRIRGSVSLVGGIIDDLTLLDYRETIEGDSNEIVVLAPRGTERAYYAQHGWIRAQNSGSVTLPNSETVWTPNSSRLSPGYPLTLTWVNPEGFSFEKQISIDDDFMFTVTQRVSNASNQPIRLHPYGLISRIGTPSVTGFYILHEGLLGVFDGVLEEVDYDDLQDEPNGTLSQSSTGGWIGITDKYWLAALLPAQSTSFNSRFIHKIRDGRDR